MRHCVRSPVPFHSGVIYRRWRRYWCWRCCSSSSSSHSKTSGTERLIVAPLCAVDDAAGPVCAAVDIGALCARSSEVIRQSITARRPTTVSAPCTPSPTPRRTGRPVLSARHCTHSFPAPTHDDRFASFVPRSDTAPAPPPRTVRF